MRSLGSAVEFRWDPFFASGTFVSGDYAAAFTSGGAGESGVVLLNHRDVLNLPLPYLERGNLRFPETFVTQVKNSFSRYAEEDRSRLRVGVIVIDPGHGGRDAGTAWDYTIQGKLTKLMEKNITLKVSRQIHAQLTAAYPDKRILITREGDTNPTKDARVAMANSAPLAANEVAIYISVHVNSSLNRTARGYEVWYLSPNYRRELIDRSRYEDSKEVVNIFNDMLEEEVTTESIMISNFILKRLDENVGNALPSRGLKTGDYFVIKNAKCPSVLVEMGFLSNETDAMQMNDDRHLMKVSDALYKGISDFVSFFERSGGFTALR
jgi:N-acetylmuramoyl-L-alanine amidase